MRFVTTRDLKNHTAKVLNYTINGDFVVVISWSKPRVIIHSISDETLEDYILLNHPEFKKKINKAYKELLAGETTSIDKLVKRAKKNLAKKKELAKV